MFNNTPFLFFFWKNINWYPGTGFFNLLDLSFPLSFLSRLWYFIRWKRRIEAIALIHGSYQHPNSKSCIEKNLKSFWAKLSWNILTSLNACSSMVSAPGASPYIWKWMLNRNAAINIFVKLTWRPKCLLWHCVQKLNPSCLCTPSPVIWLPQPRTWSSRLGAQTNLSSW